ncbi:MAG: hypothetical protein H8E40_12905 [Chloroflexi bacterium]|nr:hypothetical protein [Chloroflexota bacterium]
MYLVAALLIAFYFGITMFLSQYLHTRYIDRDQDYKERRGEKRLGLGFSFIHNFSIEPQYGYFGAKVIGICSFVTLLSFLMLLLRANNLTTAELLSKYHFLWISFPAISLLVIADIIGRSGTKLFLNITAFGMLILLVFATLKDMTFNTIMTWAVGWATVSVTLGGMGYAAFQFYISWRYKRYKQVNKVGISLHFSPALYFWGTWGVNALLGFVFVIIVFTLMH